MNEVKHTPLEAELLSALEGVTRIVEALKYTTVLGGTQVARLEAARAAIAKAKGLAP